MTADPHEPDPPGVAALLPAAGAGSRLGLGPKAYVRLGGSTILELAVAALRGRVDEIVVAVPAGTESQAAELLGDDVSVVEGGGSRQETVFRLLRATSAPLVVVHDAARPFLPGAVLQRVLEAARTDGAATAALAPADTIITAEGGIVVPREQLRAVQTPQAFQRTLLLQAHEAAVAAGAEATDDAGLVRRLGRTVTLVEGSPLLHKFTRESDLVLASALLTAWREQEGA